MGMTAFLKSLYLLLLLNLNPQLPAGAQADAVKKDVTVMVWNMQRDISATGPIA